MNSMFCLLAQLDKSLELLDKATRGGGFSGASDSLIILGFVLLLALALFCWAYFIRRRPTEMQSAHALVRPRRSRPSHRHARTSPPNDSEDSERGERVRRRRRRRKSGEVRRNPTLEETGGLPPVRGQGGSAHSSSGPPSL